MWKSHEPADNSHQVHTQARGEQPQRGPWVKAVVMSETCLPVFSGWPAGQSHLNPQLTYGSSQPRKYQSQGTGGNEECLERASLKLTALLIHDGIFSFTWFIFLTSLAFPTPSGGRKLEDPQLLNASPPSTKEVRIQETT